jgi:DNA-binding MarR family transcriptional regulator
MERPEWLSESEQRAWVGQRAVAALLDTALDRQLQTDAGISHVTYIILSVLSTAPHRTLSMTTLANFTSSSQSRMSHAVARLEERGWVTRHRSETSKRLVNATLTDAGFAILEQAAPGHVDMVRRLVFDRLSDEQVHQLDAMNVIFLQALAEHGYAVPVPPAIRPQPTTAS